jgi:high-affinity iron transporter
VLLIFVAAGIFKYGVHDFQEAGILPGLSTHAFDISGVLDPSSWYGAVVSGLFNITPQPSVLEMVAYGVYLVPVLAIFLWPSRRKAAPAAPAAPATAAPAPAANVVADVAPVAPAPTEKPSHARA